MFTLSLHELTACVYYKLAIERGLRGSNPASERIAHAPHAAASFSSEPGQQQHKQDLSADYDCKDASAADIELAIRYALCCCVPLFYVFFTIV